MRDDQEEAQWEGDYTLNPFARTYRSGDTTYTISPEGKTIAIPDAIIRKTARLETGDSAAFTLDELRASIASNNLFELLQSGVLIPEHGIDTTSRYSRSIAFLNQLNIPMSRIQDNSVLILGAGAIGSNCAWECAALGIKNLYIADMDVVEESNLNRQILYDVDDIGTKKCIALEKHLQKINPAIKIVAIDKQIQSENDITALLQKTKPAMLIEAIDTPEQIGIWTNRACVSQQVPYIRGGFLNAAAFIGPTVVPGATPCLECASGFSDNDLIHDTNGITPTFPSLSVRTASLIIDEMIRVLVSERPRYAGSLHIEQYGETPSIRQLTGPAKKCETCGYQPHPAVPGKDNAYSRANRLFLLLSVLVPFIIAVFHVSLPMTLLLFCCLQTLLVPNTARLRHRICFIGATGFSLVILGAALIQTTSSIKSYSALVLSTFPSLILSILILFCLIIISGQLVCAIEDYFTARLRKRE